MSDHPNIFDTVVFDLHPRVKEFLDQLDQTGQIDRDERNTPHIVAVERPNSSVYKCVLLRNGRQENFVLHTRKKVDPIKSWLEDGWVRAIRAEEPTGDPSRKERERRKVNPFESIMEQILRR